MSWKRWNHILHRDIGFFCIGLTLIYAVSGIAVNHLSHNFNPSYLIEKSEATTTPLEQGKSPDKNYIMTILGELNVDETYKNAAMLSPERIRIFTHASTIEVEVNTGKTTIERVSKIPVLFELNYLHLNKAKGSWTWIADLYGVALCFLAITGLLMIRGRNTGRGILLTAAGTALPVIFLFLSM